MFRCLPGLFDETGKDEDAIRFDVAIKQAVLIRRNADANFVQVGSDLLALGDFQLAPATDSTSLEEDHETFRWQENVTYRHRNTGPGQGGGRFRGSG